MLRMFCFDVKCVSADSDEEKITVLEGDSVTLHTNLTQIERDDHILWKLKMNNEDIRAAEIYHQTAYTYDQTGRYGGRLRINTQTGSLTITNITSTDSGLHELQIINSRGTLYKRFNVSVYESLPVPVITGDSSQKSSSSSKCVLLCSVMNVTHVSLSWYKGNSLLSNISVSDLNIRLSLPLEVEYQDYNTYRCVVNNTITNQTQHLNITQHCLPSSGPF
ncbi:LOW QUALITY PROTEIN: SLAM family member 9-like [Triplophysa dalaica]|uniref:LOW QUALITY PROTEIN: SLAM family member 9-like n=1 Tax=Triplophysa dalaica TaxID=1582913 RepID=UPI0024DFDF4B|nr:LOW QUALITY PROTEIN: SLAM family member 9-like [Triplophysa dalaica]